MGVSEFLTEVPDGCLRAHDGDALRHLREDHEKKKRPFWAVLVATKDILHVMNKTTHTDYQYKMLFTQMYMFSTKRTTA